LFAAAVGRIEARMEYDAGAIGRARRARLEARLTRRRSRAVREAIGLANPLHVPRSIDRECWFVTCGEAATLDAIGTWDDASGIERTVAVALCRFHAEALSAELVIPQVA
jgi:hypothetical protein